MHISLNPCPLPSALCNLPTAFPLFPYLDLDACKQRC